MSDADMSGFPKPDASVPLKTYKGCCHCQANVFTATYADVTDPKANNIVCDCSHCAKRGIIWAFPGRGAVRFEKGGDEKSLTKYKFGAKMYDHYSCSKCGTYLIGATYEPDGVVPFNIRALRGINVFDIPSSSLNGATFGAPYKPAAPPAHDLKETEKKQLYHGSCHCGEVTWAALIDPEDRAKYDCNCSICGGNAFLSVHFHHPFSDLVLSPNASTHLQSYQPRSEHLIVKTCPTCSTTIYNDQDGKTFSLNVRTLDPGEGETLEGVLKEFKFEMDDILDYPPLYVVEGA